jgi:hypothetical protein
MKGRMTLACAEHRSVAEAICAACPALAAQRAEEHIVSLRQSFPGVVPDLLMPFLGGRL